MIDFLFGFLVDENDNDDDDCFKERKKSCFNLLPTDFNSYQDIDVNNFDKNFDVQAAESMWKEMERDAKMTQDSCVDFAPIEDSCVDFAPIEERKPVARNNRKRQLSQEPIVSPTTSDNVLEFPSFDALETMMTDRETPTTSNRGGTVKVRLPVRESNAKRKKSEEKWYRWAIFYSDRKAKS